jgi:hypothetical protein
MLLGDIWRQLIGRVIRRHRAARSFHQDIAGAGGTGNVVDRGYREVPVEKVVGSVGRWRNLRSDFFYRTGRAMTERFVRVGEAMRAGKALPPVELYKVKPAGGESRESAATRYYVVDGHHRIAMARQLGVVAVDAHVVEYRLAGPIVEGHIPPARDESAGPEVKTEPEGQAP